ncbi:C-type cytochrome biogenesis protein ResA [Geomicrobium sp. JCM 19037]|uniref:hypothetical protein n=1 Tax=Geomicrobium sp. JCM 19037 TaxID=1460634 RepID=UPI00045F2B4F|nr:hypothetical protein [Geomicrobium sp. JCM 19037]GAK02479.1 C-type cytochrome biogenesis protein ResA [Geomicrobium sp. JCM 19037]
MPDSQIDLDKKAKIQQSLEEAGLHLLFINVEGRERNRGDGKQFMDNAPYTVLYVIDDGMTTYEAYRAIGVPTTVLINERGEVSERFGDKTPFTEIVQHLTPWIR